MNNRIRLLQEILEEQENSTCQPRQYHMSMLKLLIIATIAAIYITEESELTNGSRLLT